MPPILKVDPILGTLERNDLIAKDILKELSKLYNINQISNPNMISNQDINNIPNKLSLNIPISPIYSHLTTINNRMILIPKTNDIESYDISNIIYENNNNPNFTIFTIYERKQIEYLNNFINKSTISTPLIRYEIDQSIQTIMKKEIPKYLIIPTFARETKTHIDIIQNKPIMNITDEQSREYEPIIYRESIEHANQEIEEKIDEIFKYTLDNIIEIDQLSKAITQLFSNKPNQLDELPIINSIPPLQYFNQIAKLQL